MKGKVYLVGAGPGDPELLTIKALRALRSADVVFHDDLVSREILKLIPPATVVQNVGKRCGQKNASQEQINSLMVESARRGLTVVRLKGGDPLIFGRAGEEIEALRRAGMDFEIIPGVTAAAGAAAAAKISLTDRRLASRVMLATGHRAFGNASDAEVLPSPDTIVVFYMPGDDYASVSRQLQKAGVQPETPCVLVSQASRELQQVRRATVESLGAQLPLPAPALLIVGEVTATAVESSTQLRDESPLVNYWAEL